MISAKNTVSNWDSFRYHEYDDCNEMKDTGGKLSTEDGNKRPDASKDDPNKDNVLGGPVHEAALPNS